MIGKPVAEPFSFQWRWKVLAAANADLSIDTDKPCKVSRQPSSFSMTMVSARAKRRWETRARTARRWGSCRAGFSPGKTALVRIDCTDHSSGNHGIFMAVGAFSFGARAFVNLRPYSRLYLEFFPPPLQGENSSSLRVLFVIWFYGLTT